MPRPPSPLQRLHGLIAGEPALAVLLPEARRLAELNRRFMAAVPAALARTCRVACLEGETVVIHCGHGAAAARVRSQAATLAHALSDEGRRVGDIRVRVRADWALPERPAKAGMGEAALAAWQALRQELPAGELRAAVERLLRHHRQGGG